MFIHHPLFDSFDKQQDVSLEFTGFPIRLTTSGTWQLFEGWRVDFLYSGLSPVLILQLAHSTGSRAVWYLGADGARRAGTVDELDQDTKTMLKHRVATVLGQSFLASIEDPQPFVEPAAQGFLKLDPAAKADLMRLAADRLPAYPGVQLIDETSGPLLITTNRSSQQTLISREHVRSALTQDLQDSLVAAIRAGRGAFSIPNPVTGQALEVQASLCFDDFHFAYRFVEPQHGVVFYLIAGYELSQCYGMYFPQCHTIFCLPGQLALSRLAAAHLAGWLANHFISFGAEFAEYIKHPVVKMTSMLRAPPWTHIGHQLWNELTGIDRLLQETSLNGAIEWVVPDGDAPIEFYGAIEELFPSLEGIVRRGFHNVSDEIRHVYGNQRLAVRVTRDFVSASLRSRVLDFAAVSAPITAAQEHKPLGHDQPLVLLGLRVENRTLVNLATFYARLIVAIRSTFPAARFVIDGHNVAGSERRKYRSHGERVEETSIAVEAERTIVRELTDQFGASAIVSAIGLPVTENLVLINQCDFFVSMWGAGLAKYRWVCNKPGFVITSSWNLTHRSDLRIYDHPAFLENPSKIYWVDPSFVTDHPETPRVVAAGPHPQWANFALHEAPVIENIVRTLGQHVRERDLLNA